MITLDLGIRIATLLLSIAWVLVIPYVKGINSKLDKIIASQDMLGNRVTAQEVRSKYADELHSRTSEELAFLREIVLKSRS